MTPSKTDADRAGQLAARRINLKMPDHELGFSVPYGVSDADAFAEVLRIEEWVARGYARPIVAFDSGRGRTYWLKLGVSFVQMWARVAWRSTFARAKVRRQIQGYRDAFAVAVVPPPTTDSGNGDGGEG